MSNLVCGTGYGVDPAQLKSLLETGYLTFRSGEKYKYFEPAPNLAQYIREPNFILIREKNGYIGCAIEGFPAQCGMMLAHSFDWIDSTLAPKLDEVLVNIASLLRYSTIMITLADYQHELTDQFIGLGWKEVYAFHNKRSTRDNKVLIYEV